MEAPALWLCSYLRIEMGKEKQCTVHHDLDEELK